MKNKTITHVAILLDKSGSMARTKNETISGYNEQVQQIIESAKDQDVRVSLVTFNGDIWEHLWEEDASKLTEANAENYVPNGGTAMRDAIGYTIQKLIDTTDPNESDNVGYLVYVISDGETLNDRIYSVPQVKELIDGVQATGKWTISYLLGCSDAYLHQISRDYGVSLSNMAAYSNTNARSTARGMSMANVKCKSYFDDRVKGVTSKLDFMNDQLGAYASFVDDNQPTVAFNLDQKQVPTLPEAPQNVLIRENEAGSKPKEEKVSPKTIDQLKNQRNYNFEKYQSGKDVFGNSKSVSWK